MEKRRTAGDGETQLPEAIIQHIQSFLDGKEIAQTSVLSKSWYAAWYTHPNLDLDQRHFSNSRRNVPNVRQLKYSRRTMRRYEAIGRKIESLSLWMGDSQAVGQGLNRSLASELIVRALQMGATVLHMEISGRGAPLLLPREVFESETLYSLSMVNCEIDRGVETKVSCSSLKSLNLSKVLVEGDTIWDIIRSCPLIEQLILSECVCSEYHTRSGGKTTNFMPFNYLNEFRKEDVGPLIYRRTYPYQFHGLMRLYLEMVDIGKSFFSDFSTKFPLLQDLTVHQCIWDKQAYISSPTLERVSWADKNEFWAKFDVPRLRKFSFSGSCLPALTFEKTSNAWESEISVLHGEPGTLSLVRLKKFLKKLRRSRISLSFNIGLISQKNFEYVGDIEGSRRPVVENLMLLVMDAPSSICSSLLGCLFWSCCPKFITQCQLPQSWIKVNVKNDILAILLKRLVQVKEDRFVPNRSMLGQCDLEKVSVEAFDETLAEWVPMTRSTLLDAMLDPESNPNIRLHLGWAQPK
ncbi:Unknown protein [Striga hermonthica]|uniref:F-box/LRR-repeat protein 15/At3g58940/PEG3-like LRR domain-containing protein n=1 Tax=Striga hermonthica TaxID=68872 RepID=A0A9N7RG79_STRHE|nr:Unknown protein [Striga hermonthica]